MRVRFEVLVQGNDSTRLRAAAEQAVAIIHEVESDLSAYRLESDIFRLNAAPPNEWIRIQMSTFRFLEACREQQTLTHGAFDPTVGPLLRIWGLTGHPIAREPSLSEILLARESVGLDTVMTLDPDLQCAKWNKSGARFDPGAAGKGWALDLAISLLEEIGITEALMHGGTSSVRVLGKPHAIGLADGPIQSVSLRNQALGVSAPHGKRIQLPGFTGGHVMDPRTGKPVQRCHGAAIVAGTAFAADCLSTALLVEPDLATTLLATGHAIKAWNW